MKKQIHTHIKNKINASYDSILMKFSGQEHNELIASRKILKALKDLVKEKAIVKEGKFYRIANEGDYKEVPKLF